MTTDKTYLLRVSLPGIKGFARVYELKDSNSLYHFQKQMEADMEFPHNQTVLFKGLDANGNVIARYATFDLGQGSVEKISLAKAMADGVTQFTYFYDTINKYSVIITIEGEGDGKVLHPTLVESKGPNPEAFRNGYVAFEDLPAAKQKLPDDDGFVEDDDDIPEDDEDIEGDEDEDGEDEDFKEVYSEEDKD